MEKVNIGIIGAGRIGQLHARNILKSEIMELRAISDIEIKHLQNTDLEKSVPIITTNVNQLFEDPLIDAIFICSSTNTHIDLIKKAAQAGKHIFCEKPISFQLEETKKVLEIIEKHGVVFQSGFNRRFDHNFRKVFESVRADEIGQPHIIKITSRDPEIPSEDYIAKSGGMFIDMTIHDFDMIRYISDNEVSEISVKTSNMIDPIFEKYNDIDTAIITLKLKNGTLAIIDNSRKAIYGYDQRVEVFGTKGMIIADNESKSNVKVYNSEGAISDNPEYFFLDRYREAYEIEINAFARSIINDEPVQCSVEDGYQAELLAYAAKLSWKENRSVLMSEFEKRINIV